MRSMRWIVVLAATLLSTACVKKGVHDAVLEQLAAEQARAAQLTTDLEACTTRAASLDASLAAANGDLAQTDEALAASNAELATCRAGLEDARSALAATGEENARLAERLEELARIEEELRSRNAIFESILARFSSLINNGTLEVVIENGRLVIKLPQDILFESGSAELGDEGVAALSEVAHVLATFTDREFQVEGHTDNVPISTSRFPSNWELSTARALAVVRLFVEQGVNPTLVSAAGYGEFRPQASNDTPETRALNRRIGIVMVPDLAAIFGGTN